MVKKILVAIICVLFVLSFVNLSSAKDKFSSKVAIESVKVKIADFLEKNSKRIIFFGFRDDWSVSINGSDPLPDPPMPPPPPPPKGGGN